MKLSIKYFFSKCNHIRSFLRIWSHLLKKILIENLIFCAARQPINCYEIFFRYSTFCQVLGRRRKRNAIIVRNLHVFYIPNQICLYDGIESILRSQCIKKIFFL